MRLLVKLVIVLMIVSCERKTEISKTESIDISGEWNFKIDKEDKGKEEHWFNTELKEIIHLPGSMAENGYGEPQEPEGKEITKDLKTTPFWHPIKRYDYRGAAWYQRNIDVPDELEGKHLRLFLERVCWLSEVWIDNKYIGSQNSLSTPHHFDLGTLTRGKHKLTIRIDNREQHNLGLNTHGYHEQTCTIFNGVVGDMTITAHPSVFTEKTQVFANPKTGECKLNIDILNTKDNQMSGAVKVNIRKQNEKNVLSTVTIPFKIQSGNSNIEVKVKIPEKDVVNWSEFSKTLYVADIELSSKFGDDKSVETFGFRTFNSKGSRFFINGDPVLMRGEANNAMFPLTGYPEMDVKEWKKIFTLFKDFGLNHFRCHSWTPPEAAFSAADELGIYIQTELPNSQEAIKDSIGNIWRKKEFDRIIKTYGNHPSFVLMTMGNEAQSRDYSFLQELVERGRKKDNRHLYATISNPEAGGFKDEYQGDDFAVAHGSRKGRRRMAAYFNRNKPETMGDYAYTMEGRPVPQISHEIGQWLVYPDVSEIEKYKGVLRPVNLEYIRESLKEKGLLNQLKEFVGASGRLSLLLYKEEIERSLRTPIYGGFQLLGLQDSYDWGSAYVGQIDNFFEPKFYVTAKYFSQFCGPQTLLARFKKRVWLNSEVLKAGIELANYGKESLNDKTISWSVTEGENTLKTGKFDAVTIPNNGLNKIGNISFPLNGIEKATKIKLEVTVENTDILNNWELWVYPEKLPTTTPDNVIVTETITAKIRDELENGARVVLLSRNFKSNYPTAMTPPFWSSLLFPDQKQTLGFLCDNKHPVFNSFPTDNYNNWQWWELTHQGFAMDLENTDKNFRPIVQGIDHPNRNNLLGIIYEGKVGKGKLLVCTLDLQNDIENRPVARQLKYSMVTYAGSDDFNPTTFLDLDKDIPVGKNSFN